MSKRNKAVHLETTIEIDDKEIDIVVEADWSPGYKGSMYSKNGDPGDPPESPECDITSVKDANGNELLDTLSPAVLDTLREKASEKGQEEHEYGSWEE